MTMNDGRKVDKSLYKDILVDIATYQGMDASGITDTDVDDIWESTGGDPTRLMEKISINLGGTAGDVTEDTMNNLFDKYNVVDPNYTKSMMDYMTDDVKKVYSRKDTTRGRNSVLTLPYDPWKTGTSRKENLPPSRRTSYSPRG